MTDKNLIAGLIALAIVAWLFSGALSGGRVIAEEGPDLSGQPTLPLVRAIQSQAESRTVYLHVRAQTQANRVVELRSEVHGRVDEIPAQKGTSVMAGDVVCRIAVDTRQADLERARASVNSAALEHQGALDMKQRGLQSEIETARLAAQMEAARAQLKAAELSLAKTRIVAPFSGTINDQAVEIGDYLSTGQICATLMEIKPLLVVGQVAEREISRVTVGEQVEIQLINGEVLNGTVSYVSRSPDRQTRAFPIEVTVVDPGENARAGLSGEMRLPMGDEMAHLISPASLVLNDAGDVGVRLVDSEDTVRFVPVTVVSEDLDGIWVRGLPAAARVITVGQEEVFEGQTVRVEITPLGNVVRS